MSKNGKSESQKRGWSLSRAGDLGGKRAVIDNGYGVRRGGNKYGLKVIVVMIVQL